MSRIKVAILFSFREQNISLAPDCNRAASDSIGKCLLMRLLGRSEGVTMSAFVQALFKFEQLMKGLHGENPGAYSGHLQVD